KHYDQSIDDPETFWGTMAKELFWYEPPKKILEYNFDVTKGDVFHTWFEGGKTNACYNCVDRHVQAGKGGKRAIVWQGEPDEDTKTLTYAELLEQVKRFANVLKKMGVKKGDCVTLYMPMVWQLPVALLACARIGAMHSVVFGGFSSEALAQRIQESESKVLVTIDVTIRAGKKLPTKQDADRALQTCPSVEKVIVVQRTGEDCPMTPDRDSFWDDEMAADDVSGDCPCEPMEATEPLFLLYTSGSTGKPKGQVHTTGGYQVYTDLTFRWVFDIKDDDLYWCTADIGWITGHSYIVYGPLSNCASVFIYEGTPLYPGPDRAWELIERYGVTIFYTAPTAIRALERQGDEYPRKYDMPTLRILGTVGEPINPEAWQWFHKNVGKERCPIVDTWWQTETGGICITPLPGAWPTKPGSATFPFPGIKTRAANPGINEPEKRGEPMPPGQPGHLCIERPWPGLSKTIYKNHDRWVDTYFSQFPGMYFTSDGVLIDSEGYHFLQGRVDDVINVSGHRIGTAEVESAIVEHQKVAEAAAAGVPHSLKGQGIYVFVILKQGEKGSPELEKELKELVRKEIGPIATPDWIQFAPALPKTRSGKIMRRVLRKIVEGKTNELGDTSTLENAEVIDELKKGREKTKET
ncbi:MAG: acetate--CoA ligase, partial [Deltaproteobacteria bacterium]|nr:acetate--CoA ligase [Deltaproteobacteria bacterium]